MRAILKLSLCVIGVLTGCARDAPGPPNLLLVTLDTTRADVIGAYGGTSGATPHLDALAVEGALFERAYTVTPLTIPAHSSLFTGQTPPRHGVRDNGDFFLAEGASTLAEQLKAGGYATMASVSAQVTSHHWGFAQGFDAFFDDLRASSKTTANRWDVERPGSQTVDDALGWLNKERDAPFFSWVHLFDAHDPYRPPEPFRSMFPGQPYLGEVATVDAQVGRLVSWLKESNQLENTWVVVLADHGEALGAHGEATHGVLLYDETIRIPLLIRPPGGLPSKRIPHPTSLVDVMPTLLGAAGLAIPEGLDGRDLSPWMQGAPGDDAAVYAESLYAWHHYGWAPQKALITADHKLIDSTTPELYERSDHKEAKNLALDQPAVLQELGIRLRTLEATQLPVEKATERVELSADRIAQLEALGYVAGATPDQDLDPDNPPPDPVQRLGILRQVQGARRAYQSGDLTSALKQIEAVLAADPGLVDLRTLHSTVLLRLDRIPEALATLEAAESVQPSSTTRGAMGRIFLSIDPFIAVDHLAESVDRDPYVATNWSAYLHALFLTRQVERLEREALRVRTLLPDLPEGMGMLGVALAAKGSFTDAEPLLRAGLEENPLQPFVHASLGHLLRLRGATEEAETHFLEEIQLQALALKSRRQLVEIYAEQQRYEEQLQQLAALEQVEAPSRMTAHSSAQALFNLERFVEAHARVQECRQLAPRYPGCALLEANVLKKLGHEAEALAAFEAAKELVRVADLPVGD